ncbi:FixH family protein [Microvirga yunnanensis]|uniref:FixH family protein n=1 Tax=Microvirga yunnanensis TaxID=2953740 RepID=UPI00359F7D70
MPPVSAAELKDHAFELVRDEVKQGEATVDVRLVEELSGRSVPDAVIFAQRIDMAPDGMPTMTAPIELMPSPEPGIYRFKTNLTMEGGWQLSLAAKVQGQTGTVQNRLVFKAVQ